MNFTNTPLAHLSLPDQQAVKSYIQQREAFRTKALAELQKLSPKLSPDPTRAASQLDIFFLDQLDEYTFETAPDGSVTTFDKEGNRLENKQGYPLGFSEVIYQIASRGFELGAAPSDSLAFRRTGPIFKDEDDYLKQFYRAKTREERSALVDAWNKKNER